MNAFLKYKDVEMQKFTIIYCVLGKRRDSATVKELVDLNHSLGITTRGPEDR